MAERKIIHLDLDAFFCAVEELRRPELRGKPFAVGGNPRSAGWSLPVLTRRAQCGMRSAMPMGKALRLCPELIVVRRITSYYSEMSRQVMAILGEHTALLEQISIDEAFLDLSDLPQPAVELARMLQTADPRAAGAALLAGRGEQQTGRQDRHGYGKARHKGGSQPRANTWCPPGEEAAFLAPLPRPGAVGRGSKDRRPAGRAGHPHHRRPGRPAGSLLVKHFGATGTSWAARARVDDRPIVTERAKSISQETTFARDVRDGERCARCSTRVKRWPRACAPGLCAARSSSSCAGPISPPSPAR